MRCQFCNKENLPDAKFCGSCGKILINEIGRTDSLCPYCLIELKICPYCLIELKKRPLAKTKCKNCKNYIYSRSRPFDEKKVLLTEAEAEMVEIQWATINGTLDYYLDEKRKKRAIQEQLKMELGRNPSKSEIQTEHLSREIPANRERTLQTYREQSDIIQGWRWLAAKQPSTCDYCLGMDGQQFPLHVDFEPLNRCENEYCRCTIVAVIEGVEWIR